MTDMELELELRECIEGLSVGLLIGLARLDYAFAIFPQSSDPIQVDPYFAQDVPNGALDRYWDQYGPRAEFAIATDPGLFELPHEWMDGLRETLADADYMTGIGQWEILQELLELGLAAKAEQFRATLLAGDLKSIIAGAMDEYETEQAEREARI